MTHLLGLTGSIGMGKSTTADMFRDAGVPVWDADAAVHRLYDVGGAAVGPIGKVFPFAVIDGAVSRAALKDVLHTDPSHLKTLENIVHPLVKADRDAFIAEQTGPLALLDIPLLFETGADTWLDTVLVVSAPADVQAARVMARPGMTQDTFDMILGRQMPDAEKRARADVVIETLTLDDTRRAVQNLIFDLTGKSHA
ncbi:MAG: dephospho-CoA kinase [Loktanella salsilacus]|jgi:dephospho-CoA kinase|uniref:dephospho-CoA kinase n=1 Tax=Loktanella salsilacus TaxID=195913 RepID=UPI003988E3FE